MGRGALAPRLACRSRARPVTPLGAEIAGLIASEGPISVEHYMDLALSHPRYGYYRTHLPFGAGGDFITAPEISQMFGELIGLWALDCWMKLGRPSRLHLVELGPGRGTLMADALRAARIVPGFGAALTVHLVETSEKLAAVQRDTLAKLAIGGQSPRADDPLPVAWHAHFADVPQGPLIVIANEFFDALPVRQYVRSGGSWRERLVGLDEDGALTFGLSSLDEPSLRLAAEDGSVLEICPASLAEIGAIAARICANGGAALIIDYGHERPGFGDTLQAVRSHRYVPVLADPGEADVTAHVDFRALGEAARRQGALMHGPQTQGELLGALGIVARAERLKRQATAAQARSIDDALARLTGERDGQMGTLFKAMAITSPNLPAIAGFAAATP